MILKRELLHDYQSKIVGHKDAQEVNGGYLEVIIILIYLVKDGSIKAFNAQNDAPNGHEPT